MKLKDFAGKTVKDIEYNDNDELTILFNDDTKLVIDGDGFELNFRIFSWKEEKVE
jgi:hypothetical protein